MDLKVHNNALLGLPGEDVVLFLAKTTLQKVPIFCAVFGPADTCLPRRRQDEARLHNAKVAIFDAAGNHSATYAVRKGEKYIFGGGKVEIDESSENILWTAPDECGRCEFLGERISPENVFVAR